MELLKLDIFLNLSIIIPALVGMYVFKSISKAYRYFIIITCAGALHEYNAEFQFAPYFITDLVYSLCSTQLILLLYFNWDFKKTAKYKKMMMHLFTFILVLSDQYYDYISSYHIRWGMIVSMVGISLYSIRLLTQSHNNTISARESFSRKLIIMPYMVFSVYFAAINILMHFLFNKGTQPLFMDLFNVIRWINFLSYITYTLALLWAPKKEQFL